MTLTVVRMSYLIAGRPVVITVKANSANENYLYIDGDQFADEPFESAQAAVSYAMEFVENHPEFQGA